MTKLQKIVVGTIFGLGGLCFAGGYAVMYQQLGRFAAQRDTERELAKKEGLPLGWSDIIVKVPDDQNAAPLYKKGIAMLGTEALRVPSKVVSDGFGSKVDKEKWTAALAALPKFDPVLAVFEEAAKKPHVDFGRNWDLGPEVLFPEFADVKKAAKQFAMRAEVRAERGQMDGALSDIHTIRLMAAHMREEPTLIGMLVAIAMDAISDASMRQVIAQRPNDRQFLAKALEVELSRPPLPDFRHALRGEVVFGITAIPMVAKNPSMFTGNASSEAFSWAERSVFKMSDAQRAFETKLIQYWREVFRKLPTDPEKWEEMNKVMADLEIAVMNDKSAANYLNQILFPVFTQAGTAIGKDQANRRLNETALRLLIARSESKGSRALPSRLPESWGVSRIDPFSGKPFGYKPEGTGFMLYSVAEDRVDDGGKERTPGSSSPNFDNVVRFR